MVITYLLEEFLLPFMQAVSRVNLQLTRRRVYFWRGPWIDFGAVIVWYRLDTLWGTHDRSQLRSTTLAPWHCQTGAWQCQGYRNPPEPRHVKRNYPRHRWHYRPTLTPPNRAGPHGKRHLQSSHFSLLPPQAISEQVTCYRPLKSSTENQK